MHINIEGELEYVCVVCGWKSPCATLHTLHFVTAHRGGDLATNAITETKCLDCVEQSMEAYCLKVVDGKLQRTAKVGKTEALVPY